MPARKGKLLNAIEEGKIKVPKAADVLFLATTLKIHPAPIAGRIRFKHNNFRILSKLVGRGQVRKLFSEYARETLI